MLLEYVLQVFPALRDRALPLGYVHRPPIHLVYVACQLDYHVCKRRDLQVSIVLVQGFVQEGQGVSEDRAVMGRW